MNAFRDLSHEDQQRFLGWLTSAQPAIVLAEMARFKEAFGK